MGKKIISSLMTGCLAAGLLFNQAGYADVVETKIAPIPSSKLNIPVKIVDKGVINIAPITPSKLNGDVSLAKVPLDKAITTAKEAFNIGSEYDRFESGFSSYDSRAEWQLNWNKNTDPQGSVSVRINALTGQIVGMDRWDEMPPGQRYSGLPKYSFEDGSKLAREWAQKLVPGYLSQTKLVITQEQPQYGFGERGPAEYYYNFSRVINGVTFPEHNINIRVNGDTGQIVGFNLNWDENMRFPATTGTIAPDQAKKIFGENVELVYFRPQVNGGKTAPVKLIYQVKRGSGLLIDAFTGKVIEEQNRIYYDKGMGGAAEKATKQELTPVEQAEVDKFKNLLSVDKALEQAKKYVKVPSSMKQNESRLTQDYQYPELKLWNFSWYEDNKSLAISVNAESGELVSLNSWENKDQAKLSQHNAIGIEKAQKIAEEYIKKQQPRRFAEVRLEDKQANDYIWKDGQKVTESYRFSYVRLVNGIPFTNNGFDLVVDPYTGEVTSYHMSWWNVSFPSPTEIMGTDKAVSTFLADGGLALDYVRINQRQDEPQICLVYRLKDLQSYMIDSRTGQYLDWNGQPVPPKNSTSFTDIAGHPAEKDITVLAKANIIKSADGKFYPDRNITKFEAIEMLVASRGWFIEPPYRLMADQLKDEQGKQIINAAINLGIIEPNETEGLDKELTRLEFARLLINTLDYDGAAKLANIYNLKAKDANQVPDNLKGYAALSLGLGLQTDITGSYAPNDKIPRGYAATSIVRMLNIKK